MTDVCRWTVAPPIRAQAVGHDPTTSDVTVAAVPCADKAIAAGENGLSDREIQILALVAEGQANKQIAWQMGLSHDTIKAHLKTIFSKLEVSDRTHAVVTALRRGFIAL